MLLMPSNNGMYIKRGKVRNKRIVLDLHDVIGHFRVLLCLCFKASLSAKLFI